MASSPTSDTDPAPPAPALAGAQAGWRTTSGTHALGEVRHSIAVPLRGVARIFAFMGPGYLVAVGYMDPGNWATSLAGGSAFGYTLLSIVLISSLMAILLQALCARLGIAAGRDLARACRDAFPPWAAHGLWLLAEIAIAATDLAEVIGTAIALKILLGIPLIYGVCLTAADVFLILWLQRLGFRWIEALVVTLLVVIAAAFVAQLVLARPDWGGVAAGFVPNARILSDPQMLYVAIGILGATVMPHNLYLHSSIVQTRRYDQSRAGRTEAIRYATWDSTIALLFALLINAAILILAAAAFHTSGHADVAEIEQATGLLAPLLGTTLAPILFAVALLCSGLNSTVTATLAGQAVMEGFLDIRLKPWLRRLITRGIALVPAIAVTALYGESGTGQLLILSQVVLSLQLPFAMVPLVLFTADRRKMGTLRAPRWQSVLAVAISVVIIGLNIKLIVDTLG